MKNKAINDVVTIPQVDLETTDGNYAAVRFNALQHGILSRYTVLPHEDKEEYHLLLQSLLEEHLPSAATEVHLVEELAGIIWRKRRVLMAEGASINRGLYHAVSSHLDNPIPAAVPFENITASRDSDVAGLVTSTPKELAEQRREYQRGLKAVERAESILETRYEDPAAYEKALRALTRDDRENWAEWVEEGECEPNAEGLAEYLCDTLGPYYRQHHKEAKFQPEIKKQVIGEGLQPGRLEKLSRYEAHLDRKFERTLAMLLKLKELRARS